MFPGQTIMKMPDTSLDFDAFFSVLLGQVKKGKDMERFKAALTIYGEV